MWVHIGLVLMLQQDLLFLQLVDAVSERDDLKEQKQVQLWSFPWSCTHAPEGHHGNETTPSQTVHFFTNQTKQYFGRLRIPHSCSSNKHRNSCCSSSWCCCCGEKTWMMFSSVQVCLDLIWFRFGLASGLGLVCIWLCLGSVCSVNRCLWWCTLGLVWLDLAWFGFSGVQGVHCEGSDSGTLAQKH